MTYEREDSARLDLRDVIIVIEIATDVVRFRRYIPVG